MWSPSDASGSCVRYIAQERGFPFAGVPYEDMFCLYPWMEKFFMTWELDGYRNNNLHWYFRAMQDNPWIPISACLMYGTAIFFGLNYFKYRKPWDCRNMLMSWNLGLAIFSLLGFLRMLPTAVHWLKNYTWEEVVCNQGFSNVGDNPVLLWCLLFSGSKFPELIDTFFIVVHKKPLIFLHWYHHMTVLMYAWWVTANCFNPGMFFGTMNFGVHAVMYFYYFLMAAKCKPKWFQAKVITILQLAQMALGIIITGSAVHYSRTVPGCWTGRSNVIAGLLMYGSYFLLFIKFFLDKYLDKSTQKALDKKKGVHNNANNKISTPKENHYANGGIKQS